MRITVDAIPNKGRGVRFSSDDPWAAQAASQALEGRVCALSGFLMLTRKGPIVTVEATATVEAEVSCDRCAKPLVQTVEAKEVLLYHPEPTERVAAEVELSSRDLEIGWYREAIDAAAVLSEALALSLPPRRVCVDTQACIEVSLGTDDARDEVVGNPFSALKGLF